MSINIIDKKSCYGCAACMNICPVGAVIMEPDGRGFLYPNTDNTKCNGCGICEEACPAVPRSNKNEYAKEAYAVKHKDEKIRRVSTSGGAFTALSDYFVLSGGTVYGAVYTQDFYVVHERAESAVERDRMRGSKYVQSYTGDIYGRVRDDLLNNRKVFFTGTSCQTDGIKNYLRAVNCPEDNLYTCELICHGAPSPLMWKNHIEYIEMKRKLKIADYQNRSKTKGWHEHNEQITYCGGHTESQSKLSQNHKDLFYGHYIIRPCCTICPYAGKPGTADLTIGDFWGIEKFMTEYDDNKGISAVIINTSKGKALFGSARNAIEAVSVTVEQVLKYNHNKPVKANPREDEFWNDYNKYGYGYILKKYAGNTLLKTVTYAVIKRLRRILVFLKIKK